MSTQPGPITGILCNSWSPLSLAVVCQSRRNHFASIILTSLHCSVVFINLLCCICESLQLALLYLRGFQMCYFSAGST